MKATITWGRQPNENWDAWFERWRLAWRASAHRLDLILEGS